MSVDDERRALSDLTSKMARALDLATEEKSIGYVLTLATPSSDGGVISASKSNLKPSVLSAVLEDLADYLDGMSDASDESTVH